MHEGKRIEQELYSQRVNISKLALTLGITRKTIYDHFKREKADLNFIQALKEKAKIIINLSDVFNPPVTNAADVTVPNGLQNKETDWQVRQLNEYIMELQRTIIDLQQQLLQSQFSNMKKQKEPKNKVTP